MKRKEDSSHCEVFGMQAKAGETTKECIYCGQSFTQKEMARHKAEEEKSLCCHYCDLGFESLRLLRRHMYRYHKLYSCKLCDVKLLKGAYEYHLSSVHRSRPQCEVCCKSFATKLSLAAHNKKIHLGQRDGRFRCPLCEYQAPDQFQLRVHVSRHNKEPAFFCDHCGAGHYTHCELNKHIQALHCGGYRCPDCGKAFRSAEYLKRHRAVHEPGYDPARVNFTCEECGRGFLKETSFKRHALKHRGQVPTFDCHVCGKSMTSKASFNTHVRIHTGYKPFVCGTCGKAFSDKRYLAVHTRHHTGERPYGCPDCDQRFTQLSSLATHRKAHLKPVQQ